MRRMILPLLYVSNFSAQSAHTETSSLPNMHGWVVAMSQNVTRADGLFLCGLCPVARCSRLGHSVRSCPYVALTGEPEPQDDGARPSPGAAA